ncbi:TorF family putative porin [Shewanella psychrotolerans]|uniref:TorF family putative porin n=1 Tax=Shewanella psychrotolerans TaxID=2864206 RepID=UPI001C65F1B9|nr:TorF family putative porin [Shewanella psychrotolerans]QYK02221.1 TorF family putative porin [Shewanella psychrotolerans]
MYKKFNKKRIAQVTGLALSAALIAPIAQAEVSGEIGVTNDYRFRGVSQTAGEFAVQAGIDYSMENGFFVGAWGSNVDFDDPEDENGANIEIDLYVGYAGAIGEEVEYDVTLLYYTYPGDDVSQDYLEGTIGFYFADLHAAYWYTNDYGGSDLDYHYTELNYSWGFAENWSLDLHVGYNFGDAPEDDMGTYVDYSIGVSTEVAGVGLSVAWLDNDIDSEYQFDAGSFRNDSTFLVSASYAF